MEKKKLEVDFNVLNQALKNKYLSNDRKCQSIANELQKLSADRKEKASKEILKFLEKAYKKNIGIYRDLEGYVIPAIDTFTFNGKFAIVIRNDEKLGWIRGNRADEIYQRYLILKRLTS